MSQDQSDRNWVETSASFAPAVLGAAAGVIVSDLMHRDARRPVAFSLAVIGLCALAPSAVGFITDLLVGPESRHGSQKTLRRIRDAGAGGAGMPDLDDDEQMFVG